MNHQNSLHQVFDTLFLQGPDEDIFISAKGKLMTNLFAEKKEALYFGNFQHPMIGEILIATQRERVIALNFGTSRRDFITRIENAFQTSPYFSLDMISEAAQQVIEYLDGRRSSFDLDTDLSLLTDFQRKVLTETQKIPRGQVVSYRDIARQINNPKSVRAVGQALGRNPIPIIIPCHRVIASNGSLGGYSGGGGLETKIKLLQLEGVIY